ncbi:MAG: dihydrodipicolinate synthase family protein [Nesterenkonia sp.]|uniref:dihydrodipicolinate synthase family protein n=1 Tax=Nesterenkonia marinintestina TaxID=2979865 RepID=UPI0021C1436D|nr:dihydrodipicolinate synthase family protein [Nesterenkonia sp. GX14115]MDO5492289.1 dihydrodipicolinate synthase family protein [Nesterenkonia sp.]
MRIGLHAFPLTPFVDGAPDEPHFSRLVERLAGSGVDAVTVLGSTGSYAYLTRRERSRLVRTAVEHAGDMPVGAGIGALRTTEVLAHLEDAQTAGVGEVLLAPVSYQPLRDDEVAGLFEAVAAESDVPVVLYDNPTTTGFRFSDELYRDIARSGAVSAIKIPPAGPDPQRARARMASLREMLPADVPIGISGDPSAAAALAARCDGWYSVLAGTLPELCMPLMRAARSGDSEGCLAASETLNPLWNLYTECGGSLRAIAGIAEHLGLVAPDCLPRPLRGLSAAQRSRVGETLDSLGVTAR